MLLVHKELEVKEVDQEEMGSLVLMDCQEVKVQMGLLEIEECLVFKECQDLRVTEVGMD